MVGIEDGDDAGVYALGDGRALVQTIDVFTPIVDSPTDWGRISAANALSDIYAMRALPSTSLQYLAWPRDELPFEVASEVIAGGMDVMAEAGCTVVGGHSIDGPEPVYGFAVTGVADADSLVTNSGARSGDALILTKPLGVGIITTAIKREACPTELADEAIALMARLNKEAAAAMPIDVSAATDITGFGFLGHLTEMCVASNVGAEIIFESVPVLGGVAGLLAMGMWAGGSQRNYDSVAQGLDTARAVDEIRLLTDAQTSGGLLIAMPEESVGHYVAAVPEARRVGTVLSDQVVRVI